LVEKDLKKLEFLSFWKDFERILRKITSAFLKQKTQILVDLETMYSCCRFRYSGRSQKVGF
jgi:hypothetical protein